MGKADKLVGNDFKNLKTELQKIVDMIDDGRNYPKTIGCFAMIERYAKSVQEKLLQDSGCKDIFY